LHGRADGIGLFYWGSARVKKYRSEKLVSLTFVLLSAFLLSGVNRCQQDYYFANKVQIGATPTSTGEVEDETPSPSPTSQTSSTSTPTPIATATPASSFPAYYMKSQQAATILQALSNLNKQKEESVQRVPETQKQEEARPVNENWIGEIGKKKDLKVDSDNDGFSDELEMALNSDPENSSSHPRINLRSSLSQRLASEGDANGNGILDKEERDLSSLKASSDRLISVCAVGLIALQGLKTDLLISQINDVDADCLGHDFEISYALNPENPDTDQDALSDGQELLLGSDPLKSDTDGDGILDGKEVNLGSDPLVADTSIN